MQKHFIPGTNCSIFSFKDKFSFGIDAILLSNFVNIKSNKKLIDIGAGTGIVGFRINCLNVVDELFLIEIQKDMAKLIEKSISFNCFKNVKLINEDLKNTYDFFENSSIDYIVSNPPYKKIDTGILNDDKNFLISRYEYSLKLCDILEFSYKKLKSNGKVFLIYSMERLVDVFYQARKYKLEPKRIQFVCSNYFKKPHLFMVELVKNAKENLFVEDIIFIYDKDNNYTKKIKEIYYG